MKEPVKKTSGENPGVISKDCFKVISVEITGGGSDGVLKDSIAGSNHERVPESVSEGISEKKSLLFRDLRKLSLGTCGIVE